MKLLKPTIAKLLLPFLLVLSFINASLLAQTTLSRGDIAITAFCTACTPKTLAFVTWKDLSNNTVIKFTNNTFLAASSANTTNNARALQQGFTWTNTTGSTIPAGTVITFSGSGASGSISIGSVSPLALGSGGNGSYPSNSNSGGKWFVYQGADYSASTSPATFNGNILFGITYVGFTFGANNFSAVTSPGSFQSYLPSELNSSTSYYLNGLGASSINEGQYAGSRTSATTLAAYQSMVTNPANWTSGSATTLTVTTTSFTGSSLPLTWVSFTARKANGNTELNWSTAMEENTNSFTVQHQTANNGWENLAVILAAGNSTTLRNYSYTHMTPANGINYYRILQTDINGDTRLSEIRSVNFSLVQPAFAVMTNPVKNGSLTLQVNKQLMAALINSAGSVLKHINLSIGVQTIPVNNLSKGIYWLQSGHTTAKFIVE